MTENGRDFDSREFIHARLHDGQRSAYSRYRELVVGERGFWHLLWHEMVTLFLGPIPGALGLALRRLFYPGLFRRCGSGVVFGRSVVLRNTQNIEIGEAVVVDDYCLIDGRGGDSDPVVIGDRVLLNRGVVLQAKIGTIRIGDDCNLGAGCCLSSQGGVYLGRHVSLGGNCHIGGGLFRTQAAGEAKGGEGEHRKFTRGPVEIGDHTAMGMDVLVLDNVRIGARCVVDGGAVVRESIPDATIATPHQRLVLLPRDPTESG